MPTVKEKLIERTKEQKDDPTIPVETFNNAMLNTAAENLIHVLPDHVSEIIKAMAQEYTIQLWHLVAGILLEVHSEGRLSSFQLYPDWQDGIRQTMAKCAECKEFFKPKRIGQKFCTNACAEKEAFNKRTELEKKQIIEEEIQRIEKEKLLREALKLANANTNSDDSDKLPSFIDESGDGWSADAAISV